MFTRIHSFKFQNEFAKDSIKLRLEGVAVNFFTQGLLMQCFIDIDSTNLYMVNTWDSAESSEKVFNSLKERIFTQAREMGVKISIFGGTSTIRFSDANLLENFSEVSNVT